ncbi:hypothetical protein B0H14DRAFT_2561695 [Mycena olivaceomarginata]|nr:hypothetical protein B0H14DRAFT_2561695 [Mycena olivaceomarginata]
MATPPADRLAVVWTCENFLTEVHAGPSELGREDSEYGVDAHLSGSIQFYGVRASGIRKINSCGCQWLFSLRAKGADARHGNPNGIYIGARLLTDRDGDARGRTLVEADVKESQVWIWT